MKISVAMASYNGERFIEEQLKSIMAQTRKVDELIISDDGSNDRTVAISRDFIKKNNLNWKVLINTGPHGVKNNFFNVLSHVHGDIVILCDQDDIWMKEKVECIEKLFLQFPQIQGLNTSFKYIDEFGKEILTKKKIAMANNNLIPEKLLKGEISKIPFEFVISKNISPGMTMAVSKKTVDLYLNYSKKAYLHDHELNCIAALLGGLYFYNKILSEYRIHTNQAVSISNIRRASIRSKCVEKIHNVKTFILVQKIFINEMKDVSICVGEGGDTLPTLEKYVLSRERVVKGDIFSFIRETLMALNCTKNGIYIDYRYCLIDLLTGIKTKIEDWV